MASIRAIKVISGGQCGVDQIALEIARAYKRKVMEARGLAEEAPHEGQIQTGGWMPQGWRTIEGRRPEFKIRYGMRECPVPGYPPRTSLNVRDAHLTLWFGDDSAGKRCTANACKNLKRNFVTGTKLRTAESVLRILRLEAHCMDGDEGPMILNVAGTRYRESAGGQEATKFLTGLFDWYLLWV